MYSIYLQNIFNIFSLSMDCPSYIFTFFPKKEKVIINEEKKEEKS